MKIEIIIFIIFSLGFLSTIFNKKAVGIARTIMRLLSALVPGYSIIDEMTNEKEKDQLAKLAIIFMGGLFLIAGIGALFV